MVCGVCCFGLSRVCFFFPLEGVPPSRSILGTQNSRPRSLSYDPYHNTKTSLDDAYIEFLDSQYKFALCNGHAGTEWCLSREYLLRWPVTGVFIVNETLNEIRRN